MFVLILATLMVPFQVIIIPTFLIVRTLGLIDTLGALILPNLAGAFGIFMLRQFFRTLADRARGGGEDRRRLAAGGAVQDRACRCRDRRSRRSR